jgi:hypothetical protein
MIGLPFSNASFSGSSIIFFPKKIYFHCPIPILVLLNQLKHKSLLFQTSITLDSSSLEDLTNLLLVIDLDSLVRWGLAIHGVVLLRLIFLHRGLSLSGTSRRHPV